MSTGEIMRREHRDRLPLFTHILERLDSNLLPRLSVLTRCWRGVGTMSGLGERMWGRYVGGQDRTTASENGVCSLRSDSANGDDSRPQQRRRSECRAPQRRARRGHCVGVLIMKKMKWRNAPDDGTKSKYRDCVCPVSIYLNSSSVSNAMYELYPVGAVEVAITKEMAMTSAAN